MRPSPKWAEKSVPRACDAIIGKCSANYIIFIIASANAVCTGDILRTHQKAEQPTTEHFQASPSFYYHYQQHRGQPTQQIHVEFPQQTSISSPPQTYTTVRPLNRFTPKAHERTANHTPSPFVEYPVDDTEERRNTSNKLYFEDHNGNDTHREHHYRHVTVNHYYYNATNATEGASPSKEKDVKHHYYYNEYKHDHRNKTADPNVKHHYYLNEYKHDHRNKTDDSNTKHHYYYNEYKHDHRNKTGDSTVKHYYDEYKHNQRNKTDDSNVKHHNYNEYKRDSNRNKTTGDSNVKHYYDEYKYDHRNKTGEPNVRHHYSGYKNEHRNKTDDPNVKHYYYYNDHRNKTEGDTSVKHYYYSTNRTVTATEAPKVQHYYYKDEDNVTSRYDDYDASVIEEDHPVSTMKVHSQSQPITDAHGIEDYEYVTPDPKPIVKHHHYFKEYHYKNGQLVSNKTSAEPPRHRPYSVSEVPLASPSYGSTKSGRFLGFPVIPIVKDTSYDKRFGYLGTGSGYPFFGWVKPQNDPSYRHRRPTPNGSSGYYLVDPLGRFPTFKIHASLLGSPAERNSRRVHGYVFDSPYPEAVSYHHVTRVQPTRRLASGYSSRSEGHSGETFADRFVQVEPSNP